MSSERKQIRVVDDEANLRRVLSAQLTRDGYDVHTAEDGEAGLALLREHHIDLVITDLRMPKVDGMDLLRGALRDDPTRPVVMLTAHGTVDNAVEALKTGAFDYLTKPFDQNEVRIIVRKALRTLDPALLVIMETELWPNLIREARRRGTPVAIANGRVSPRSFPRYLRSRFFWRRVLQQVDLFLMQAEPHAERVRALGAPAGRVHVPGNLKYDATPDAHQLQQGRAWRAASPHPVVMFASSREGEEVDFFRSLPRGAGMQWLVVPRHPQRFDEVASLAQQAGLTVSRRSTWQGGPPGADVWLFGHVADGNVHVNVTGVDPADESVDDAVLRLVVEHGGSISAEHGIGRAKRRWLHLARTPAELAAFTAIKRALDPEGILNPGVLLPDP